MNKNWNAAGQPRIGEAKVSATTESGTKADDRVAIPLDPEVALRALLKVDPHSEPSED